MAGARVQKIGSVFSRVQALIRCGALSESERPVWYDVYQAFPPETDPVYNQRAPLQEPIDMFYREDLIRAKFNKMYGCPDIIDMKDHKNPSLSQRFVRKYMELEQNTVKSDIEIFKETTEVLKSEGFKLRQLDTRKKEQKKPIKVKEESSKLSSEQVFGYSSNKTLDDQEDYVEEENYKNR